MYAYAWGIFYSIQEKCTFLIFSYKELRDKLQACIGPAAHLVVHYIRHTV